MARLPNTLIVGAAKSGTTSLYDYLQQHPDVFMSPVKEPRYFAYAENPPAMAGPGDEASNRESGAVYTMDAYRALFEGAADEAVVGEASPVYLYDADAPRLIAEHCPDATLIVVLRNPVERAYSHFLHLVRSGREPLRDFEAALDAEPRRIEKGWEWSWHYRRMGGYAAQLARYRERFADEQIQVYFFEDLKADTVAFAQRVYRALGIDDTFTPSVGAPRRSTGYPRWQWFQNFLHTPSHPLRRAARRVLPEWVRDRVLTSAKNANLKKPLMSRAARRRLVDAYREDVHRLEALLDRDLSHWLEPA